MRRCLVRGQAAKAATAVVGMCLRQGWLVDYWDGQMVRGYPFYHKTARKRAKWRRRTTEINHSVKGFIVLN